MNLDLRTERSIVLPRIGNREVVIGWECHRPFIAANHTVLDEDGHIESRRDWLLGGCRSMYGPGCEFECAGCSAWIANIDAQPEESEDWALADAAATDAARSTKGRLCVAHKEEIA